MGSDTTEGADIDLTDAVWYITDRESTTSIDFENRVYGTLIKKPSKSTASKHYEDK